MSSFRVTGLCAAPFTPFDETTHDLSLPAVQKQVEELVASGVAAAFVGGTTGESLSLTLSERKALLEEWIKCGTNLKIIAHVGCEALRETIELAMHAKKAGAHAIGLMPPTFIKPANLEALVELISEVARSVPDTPVYYYHISCMTGVDFNMESLLSQVESKGIPNFCGIKFTDYKIHEFMNCVRNFGGKYDMLYGRDEMLLSALAIGAKGAVGSTYNYMGKVYVDLIKAFEAGDMAKAQELQHKSLKVISLLGQGSRYGGGSVDVGKAILELKGVPMGPPRLPRKPMPQEGKQLLQKDLEALGFFEW